MFHHQITFPRTACKTNWRAERKVSATRAAGRAKVPETGGGRRADENI